MIPHTSKAPALMGSHSSQSASPNRAVPVGTVAPMEQSIGATCVNNCVAPRRSTSVCAPVRSPSPRTYHQCSAANRGKTMRRD